MKKRYFKFTDATDTTNPPGILSGTHGIDQMVAAMKATGYQVKEIDAKQAARIRQQQNRSERLAERVQQALEDD